MYRSQLKNGYAFFLISWLDFFNGTVVDEIKRLRNKIDYLKVNADRFFLFYFLHWFLLFIAILCVTFTKGGEERKFKNMAWSDGFGIPGVHHMYANVPLPENVWNFRSGGYLIKRKRRRWHNSWKKQLKYTAQWPKLTFHKY